MKSGQLIKASVNSLPLINHYGIVVNHFGKLYVMHNAPFKSSVIEPIEEWLNSRKILEIKDTNLVGLSNEYVISRFVELCKKDYNLFSYNCEHFVDCMLNQKSYSEQIQKWSSLAAISFFIFMIIRR